MHNDCKLFPLLFLLLITSINFLSATVDGQSGPALFREADSLKMNHWVDSVFDAMSYDERIGQVFMVIADPSPDERNMRKMLTYIDSIHIGGVLFSKGMPVSQAEITNRMQKASRTPLLIALDGEWGLSMRLTGTTRFPRNMMLGAISDVELITEYGREVGRQCREMGIHVNFAPDLDVNSNSSNPVIGTRSFGEDPKAVADKGLAYSRGLESAGILSVAKHFPGHGDTSDDSHKKLPVVKHNRSRLDSIELYPFKRYIDEGFGGVMTAHLYVPALDAVAGRPSSLSAPVVTKLLREEYGFGGLLFTDALAMKGASTGKADNPSVRALQAGNDVVLGTATPQTDFRAVRQAIAEGVLDLKDIEAKCLKILRYKYIAGLHERRTIETKGLEERINTPHAAWLAAKLNAEGLTLLKNDSGCVPLRNTGGRRIAALSLGESETNEFTAMLNRYDSVACFGLPRDAKPAARQKVFGELAGFDLIICAVHTVRAAESAELRQLSARRDVVIVFFTQPYFCSSYAASVGSAKAVLMAYEDTPLSRSYAAQLLFGGTGAGGKLPVGIPDLFPVGTGISTSPTRLAYHEPEEAGMDAAALAGIDSIVATGLRERAYPGCQVLVARKGIVVYEKAFGFYDYEGRRRVTEESVYDLASVTKTVGTLAAVMLEYDGGKFGLTDSIGRHVEELKGSNKESLSIRDLLYHETGVIATLPFSVYKKAAVRDSAGEGFSLEAGRRFFVADAFRDTLMESIRGSKLGAKGKYLYSCINFVMLQKMVEAQSGRRLDSLLRETLYDRIGARKLTYNPLRSFDTLLIVPTETDNSFRKQSLRGYVHDEVAAFQGGVSGNAGLFSNANDLAKMLQVYLNRGTYGGERLLSESTVELFTRSKTPTSRRGLGFDKPDTRNLRLSPCGELAPPSVYGHTGYTGTCFWIDPDNELIYIFLSNRVYPTRENTKLSSLHIRTGIQDVIYRSLR
ncbi:MAG: serine hydrolase [Tannerellaceae bacterium]|jgi:beta-glucosidase-like glycosyl hydrolase/CubicO group peptidase (beta-lactamase class C family)|nr:serine hydrolase [Tannerellaceae bacterium]